MEFGISVLETFSVIEMTPGCEMCSRGSRFIANQTAGKQGKVVDENGDVTLIHDFGAKSQDR
jgi:hypothetical protein